MASSNEVKQYLAHWFQLGKKVYIRNGDISLLPSKIFHDTQYSAEFDRVWKIITSELSGDCYLEDTTQTIDQLLTSKWEMVDCARCRMTIPLQIAGLNGENCPCDNLPNWPNNSELPAPISQAAIGSKLLDIHQRLDLRHGDNARDRAKN